jgi:hypothetical protein
MLGTAVGPTNAADVAVALVAIPTYVPAEVISN